jgi:hypothetical protein
MRRTTLVTIPALALGLTLSACGGTAGTKEASHKKVQSKPCAYHYCSPDNAPAPTTITVPAPTTTTTPPEFPKEVPVSSIGDSRVRNDATRGDPSVAIVVEVAPGVYAQEGHSGLQPLSAYAGVFGLCADVKPYEEAHQVGGVCW